MNENISWAQREAFNDFFGEFIKNAPRGANRFIIKIDKLTQLHLEQKLNLNLSVILALFQESRPDIPIEVLTEDQPQPMQIKNNIGFDFVDVSDTATRDYSITNRYNYQFYE